MRRRRIAALIALLALQSVACAEVYAGVTTAFSEVVICAEADGVLESVCMEAGEEIRSGEVIAEYRTQKAFASQDGSVAVIHDHAGDPCGETVLEILPMEKYTVYCTVDNAYSDTETMLVHSGERLYIKCTANGTHRGIGVVTNIDGEEYGVLTVGGEFHVGETVYLYRDAEFSAKQRVGIGTVIESATEKYAADGTVVGMYVAEGEEVERGQLLFETVSGKSAEIRADVSGIVSGVNVTGGEAVQKGQALASVVPRENIRVAVDVDESALTEFRRDARVGMILNADREETLSYGTVQSISGMEDQGLYRIMIVPDETDGLKLGMTVKVQTGD